MSAAEMREAAARLCERRAAMHVKDGPSETTASLLAYDIRALPLPDEEGMVERVARAIEAADAFSYEHMALAALRAINGGK